MPSATGRYIVAQPPVPTSYLSKVLSDRFPQFKFPAGKEDDSSEISYDTSKVRLVIFLAVEPCLVEKEIRRQYHGGYFHLSFASKW